MLSIVTPACLHCHCKHVSISSKDNLTELLAWMKTLSFFPHGMNVCLYFCFVLLRLCQHYCSLKEMVGEKTPFFSYINIQHVLKDQMPLVILLFQSLSFFSDLHRQSTSQRLNESGNSFCLSSPVHMQMLNVC